MKLLKADDDFNPVELSSIERVILRTALKNLRVSSETAMYIAKQLYNMLTVPVEPSKETERKEDDNKE